VYFLKGGSEVKVETVFRNSLVVNIEGDLIVDKAWDCIVEGVFSIEAVYVVEEYAKGVRWFVAPVNAHPVSRLRVG